MLDDDPKVAQRALREQIDEDVANFIASLDEDEDSGVPPPPRIEISEVETQPAELEFIPLGPPDAEVAETTVPVVPPPPSIIAFGACCVDGVCSIQGAAQCAFNGGEYQGDGTTCDPDPCASTGACCTDGSCSEETESDCTAMGGEYQGDGTTCEDTDCTQGACCNQGFCTTTDETSCWNSGGVYMGDGTSCDTPDICAMPACAGCYFPACDGSGRGFHTRTTYKDASLDTDTSCTPCGTQHAGYSTTKVENYPESCEYTCTCSGTSDCTYACPGYHDPCSCSNSITECSIGLWCNDSACTDCFCDATINWLLDEPYEYGWHFEGPICYSATAGYNHSWWGPSGCVPRVDSYGYFFYSDECIPE